MVSSILAVFEGFGSIESGVPVQKTTAETLQPWIKENQGLVNLTCKSANYRYSRFNLDHKTADLSGLKLGALNFVQLAYKNEPASDRG
jgi:hypothetical protein